MHTFFADNISDTGSEAILDELNSKHLVQVLRMQYGNTVWLCDGKGKKAEAMIISADKRKAALQIKNVTFTKSSDAELVIAVAFTKNKSRNEWLLEKVTELGVTEIVPVICTRSEKEKFNYERMNSILVSAMLQSQQVYLPFLHQQKNIKEVVNNYDGYKKLIAHCNGKHEPKTLRTALDPLQKSLILIGPEGDFTKEEVQLCIDSGFEEVSLGKNRLRTETAAVYASAIFNSFK